MLKDTGSFFFSIYERHQNNQGSILDSDSLQMRLFIISLIIYLAQHAQGHVDGGQ